MLSLCFIKEQGYKFVLRYKLVDVICLQVQLPTYPDEEYHEYDHFPLSLCRQKNQHTNGEPEIKHGTVFTSSLLKPRLKIQLHTDLI